MFWGINNICMGGLQLIRTLYNFSAHCTNISAHNIYFREYFLERTAISNDPPLFKSQQEKYPVYNGQPANRRGPPIAIYHTAFAQLKDAFVGHLEAKNELGSRDNVESKML